MRNLQTGILMISALLATKLGAETINCVIEPKQMIKVNTAVNGIISTVNVQRGDFVTQGQIVATLESAVEKTSVALASARANNRYSMAATRSRIKFLQSKLSRLTNMNKASKFASDAEIEEVSTDLTIEQHKLNENIHQQKIAQLELAQAKAVFNQRTIRSPIEGVVVEKRMSRGEYRSEDTHIVTIAQINPLNVEVFVPFRLHHKVTLGEPFKVTLETPFDDTYTATVTVIDQVFDAASGTFGVRLSLPNEDNTVPSGVKCTVVF